MIRNGPKRTISTNSEFRLLHLIGEIVLIATYRDEKYFVLIVR